MVERITIYPDTRKSTNSGSGNDEIETASKVVGVITSTSAPWLEEMGQLAGSSRYGLLLKIAIEAPGVLLDFSANLSKEFDNIGNEVWRATSVATGQTVTALTVGAVLAGYLEFGVLTIGASVGLPLTLPVSIGIGLVSGIIMATGYDKYVNSSVGKLFEQTYDDLTQIRNYLTNSDDDQSSAFDDDTFTIDEGNYSTVYNVGRVTVEEAYRVPISDISDLGVPARSLGWINADGTTNIKGFLDAQQLFSEGTTFTGRIASTADGQYILGTPDDIIRLITPGESQAIRDNQLSPSASNFVSFSPFVISLKDEAPLQLTNYVDERYTIKTAGLDVDGNEFVVASVGNGALIVVKGTKNNFGQVRQVDTVYSDPGSGISVKRSASVDPITHQETSDVNYSINFGSAKLIGNQIAGQFGSGIGALIAGNGFFEQVAGRTIGGLIGKSLFTAGYRLEQSLLGLDGSSNKSLLQIDVNGALTDAAGRPLSIVGEGKNALATALMAEAAQALGLKGAEAQVFSNVAGSATEALLENISESTSSLITSADILKYFKGPAFLTMLGTVVGSTYGSKFSNEILPVHSAGEAVFVSSVEAFDGTVGGTIGGSIGSALGPLGTLVGSTIGSFLGSFIGHVEGFVVYHFLDIVTFHIFGDVLNKLINGDPHPAYLIEAGYDPTARAFVMARDDGKHESQDMIDIVTSITSAYLETINSVLSNIGGQVSYLNWKPIGTGLDHVTYLVSDINEPESSTRVFFDVDVRAGDLDFT